MCYGMIYDQDASLNRIQVVMSRKARSRVAGTFVGICKIHLNHVVEVVKAWNIQVASYE